MIGIIRKPLDCVLPTCRHIHMLLRESFKYGFCFLEYRWYKPQNPFQWGDLVDCNGFLKPKKVVDTFGDYVEKVLVNLNRTRRFPYQ